jgi:SAM-dependent methyltransferase
VVDVGCGGGILARELTHAGFEVLGIDASPSMIAIARTTAPTASFETGSFDRYELPPCVAITAIGEVLNYGTLDGVRAFIRRAARALESGGMLIFDIAARGSYPAHDERRIGGEDWSVIVIKDSDGAHLTRRVWTFRDVDGSVRRDEEVHELELYDRDTLVTLLHEAGFRVTTRRSYGTRRLPKGHLVFVAK